MRNVKFAVVSAALALGLIATPAIAQDKAPKKADTQQVGQATFGNLIAALNNVAVEIGELNALNNLTIGDVKVVNVEDVLKGNNVEAFNNALNRNKTEIAKLTNVLNSNTVLTDFLKNNNIAVSRVVAIDVLSGGGVTLFVQPQTP